MCTPSLGLLLYSIQSIMLVNNLFGAADQEIDSSSSSDEETPSDKARRKIWYKMDRENDQDTVKKLERDQESDDWLHTLGSERSRRLMLWSCIQALGYHFPVPGAFLMFPIPMYTYSSLTSFSLPRFLQGSLSIQVMLEPWSSYI